ncbi:protein VASP homolog isoform X2 [Cuculus canorus]|uniref:protein VASP homolog isoform X2 n=1 Tax=Cuculus canorus TaxID=55661 RepID=UPI0023AA5838|nr:protein VASP homolog isoform X2 [Cuculus canorus]
MKTESPLQLLPPSCSGNQETGWDEGTPKPIQSHPHHRHRDLRLDQGLQEPSDLVLPAPHPWIQHGSLCRSSCPPSMDPAWIPLQILLPSIHGSSLDPSADPPALHPWIQPGSLCRSSCPPSTDPAWIPLQILLPSIHGSSLDPSADPPALHPWIQPGSLCRSSCPPSMDPAWIPLQILLPSIHGSLCRSSCPPSMDPSADPPALHPGIPDPPTTPQDEFSQGEHTKALGFSCPSPLKSGPASTEHRITASARIHPQMLRPIREVSGPFQKEVAAPRAPGAAAALSPPSNKGRKDGVRGCFSARSQPSCADDKAGRGRVGTSCRGILDISQPRAFWNAVPRADGATAPALLPSPPSTPRPRSKRCPDRSKTSHGESAEHRAFIQADPSPALGVGANLSTNPGRERIGSSPEEKGLG